jgi:hypothetical protein
MAQNKKQETTFSPNFFQSYTNYQKIQLILALH